MVNLATIRKKIETVMPSFFSEVVTIEDEDIKVFLAYCVFLFWLEYCIY